ERLANGRLGKVFRHQPLDDDELLRLDTASQIDLRHAALAQKAQRLVAPEEDAVGERLVRSGWHREGASGDGFGSTGRDGRPAQQSIACFLAEFFGRGSMRKDVHRRWATGYDGTSSPAWQSEGIRHGPCISPPPAGGCAAAANH